MSISICRYVLLLKASEDSVGGNLDADEGGRRLRDWGDVRRRRTRTVHLHNCNVYDR